MAKFRCPKEVISAGGHLEFEVEAETEEEAKRLFMAGGGELMDDFSEVTHIGPYDLDAIWQED